MALETENPKSAAVDGSVGDRDASDPIARSPLIELLVEHGKIDRREAERVNRLANETHEQTDILLTRLGLITEDALAHLLSELLGIPLVDRSEYPDSPLLENQLGPNKIEPGICGCGRDDNADSDGDGVPDCHDQCLGVDDAIFAPDCVGAIPSVSTWGLIVLSLLLLTGGKLFTVAKQQAPA